MDTTSGSLPLLVGTNRAHRKIDKTVIRHPYRQSESFSPMSGCATATDARGMHAAITWLIGTTAIRRRNSREWKYSPNAGSNRRIEAMWHCVRAKKIGASDPASNSFIARAVAMSTQSHFAASTAHHAALAAPTSLNRMLAAMSLANAAARDTFRFSWQGHTLRGCRRSRPCMPAGHADFKAMSPFGAFSSPSSCRSNTG